MPRCSKLHNSPVFADISQSIDRMGYPETGGLAMWAKRSAVAVLALWLAGTSAAKAQDEVLHAPAPASVDHGGPSCARRGFSWEHLCAWATYRPAPLPPNCYRRHCSAGTSMPPLYMYFLGLYGPRSPALGYGVYGAVGRYHGGDGCPNCRPRILPPAGAQQVSATADAAVAADANGKNHPSPAH
jgi:hypothetical protein